MNKQIRAAVMRHALAEYPREACGLVIRENGRRRYVACRNLAASPGDDFRLDPQDYAAAEDRGAVLAVVHSHPDAPPAPSVMDRLGCEASALPWHIVEVRGREGAPVIGGWAELTPSGYRAPLVGRPWRHGVLDCWAVCRDFYAREWGLELPDFERADGWWTQPGQDLYMQHYAAAGFVPVSVPRHGDMIVMQIRADRANHAGIYLESGVLASEPQHYPAPGSILHHLHGSSSRRDVYGGYWAECTRLILRHRSAMTEG